MFLGYETEESQCDGVDSDCDGIIDEALNDPVRSKYYFDKLTYDISYLDSKFLKKVICSIFTSLSCFILVT